MRRIALVFVAAVAALGQDFASITPRSLAGHVEFLASDALGGRDTPSPGLDAAAAYIQAQFRRIGLETPGGATSYYQTANWRYRTTPLDEVRFSFQNDGMELTCSGERFRIFQNGAVAVENAPVYKLALDSLEELKTLKDGALEGKLALGVFPTPADLRNMAPDERRKFGSRSREFATEVERLKPAAVLSVMRRGGATGADGELIGAEMAAMGPRPRRYPRIHSDELLAAWKALPFGDTKATATLKVPEPVEENVALHNVIGVLPGSDPVLKDSYVLVSAHYDHIGRGGEGADTIYNGANDDASGTAALIEIASSLASRTERPKRTIVFLAVFGEEKGLLGAYYYAKHPVFPLAKTVADINLEHLGRTDDNEGARLKGVSVTGFDFSTLPAQFAEAGKPLGVDFSKHTEHSDDFFPRSDNFAFAEAGIPAHTFCVAFEFPDYHGLKDNWDKLDYENMTSVTRALAAGIVATANAVTPPTWNKENPRTEKYRTARSE